MSDLKVDPPVVGQIAFQDSLHVLHGIDDIRRLHAHVDAPRRVSRSLNADTNTATLLVLERFQCRVVGSAVEPPRNPDEAEGHATRLSIRPAGSSNASDGKALGAARSWRTPESRLCWRHMAKQCFCGCGRSVPRFPLGTRAINTRGKQVSERLRWAEEHGGRDVPELAIWFVEGEHIAADLADVTHGELDPRALDERFVRRWQASGRDLLRNQVRGGRAAMANFGSAIRQSGMSDDEVLQALATAVSDRGMSADEATEALRRGELRP